MAIDTIPYPEAENLAQADKGFYPLRIPVSHWQLRHYISTPEPDLLYYASGADIFCLNTASRKRKHIATLPFEARCTASGFGYVCVAGGENDGHFAAIKLDGSAPRTMDVDAALPIDQHWRQSSSTGRRAASVKVERIGEEIVNSISIHRIQDEDAHLDDIVAVLTNNDKSVRLYSLPLNQETSILELPFPMNHATISPDGQSLVAVGDVNLAYFFQREIQETPPQIPKPHNRLTSASIEWTLTNVVSLHVSEPANTMCYFTTAWSPSGQLVAVGSEGGYITVFDIDLLNSSELEGEDAIVAIVAGSRPDFTNPHPGAVRSMVFSPEPWDLLVWAEDQGRVCIGDLRTGLKSRQIVHLEPKDGKLQRIDFEDVQGDNTLVMDAPPTTPRDVDELEADFIRRYRQAPDNATAVNFATEYIEARRRQRQQRADVANMRAQMNAMRDSRDREATLHDDDPRGLTAREQQILESLRTSRQREEARVTGIPRSVNYTTAESFAASQNPNRSAGTSTTSAGDSAAASASSSTRRISELLSGVQDLRDSFPELSRTNARPTSSHGPESQQDRLSQLSLLHAAAANTAGGSDSWNSSALVRLSDGSRLPRRRQSVILSPPASNSPSASGSANQASTAATYRPPTATSAAAAAQEEDENPWRTIEEHMTLARGPVFEQPSVVARARAAANAATATESREEAFRTTEAELATERARARSLARQRDRWTRMRTTAANNADTPPPSAFHVGPDEVVIRRAQMRGGYSGREIGIRTAGLAMSGDGRTLWAACEEGIFEVEIARKGRLFLPSREPR